MYPGHTATQASKHTHRQTASVFVCALVFYWLVLFTVSIGVVYRGHSVSFCCWERNRFCIWTKARDCCVIANLLILWQHNSWEQDFKWAQYSYIALLSYKKNIYIYTVYKDKSGVEVCFILKYLLKQKWWIQDLKKHYKI